MDKDLIIRKATESDIDAVMEILAEARGTMAKLGIDQWQDGYPQREIIENDVREGFSYCIENTRNGEILATFGVFTAGDLCYDKIFCGEWTTGESLSSLGESVSYTAIHRVAISVKSRGQGLSTAIIDFAADKARNKGKKSLRIDTHEGNVVMRRMLEKHGFIHCGTIYLESGDARVAYEKVL